MTDMSPLTPALDAAGPGSFGFIPSRGGVCAAKGIRAAGISAGFRRNPNRRDLALVVADESAVCAATFTKNRYCAAPVLISRQRATLGRARAIILNSGNANAATGEPGLKVAVESAELLAHELGCSAEEVLVASTGVIGQVLSIDRFQTGIPPIVAALAHSDEAAHHAACAVMTTDTHPKEAALVGLLPIQREEGAVTVHVGGFCKGSGMIQPDMATMLCVVTTDANLAPEAASRALYDAVGVTFNKVTVDSDTSTNDSCFLLATGAAGGDPITESSEAYPAIVAAIKGVCGELARAIAADGEGATKLVTVDVTGAASDADADMVARSIANSPLVKTCIFGHDANWGRVAMAAGKCGVPFEQTSTSIDFLGVPVVRDGLNVPVDEEDMLRRFEAPEVPIVMDLGMGVASTRIWTCDLTHDYISINGDYRS